MGLVDALQQHFLTKKKKEKDHISRLPQRKNSIGDLHVDRHTCVYLLGMFRIMNVVRLSLTIGVEN